MDWKKAAKYSSPVGFAASKAADRRSDPEVQARKEAKHQAREAKQQSRAAAAPEHKIRVGNLTAGVITVKDGRVHGPTKNHGSVALAGARAIVETSGDVDRRVTATRLVMTGPLAFGLRKKKDRRELFLTVEGSDGVFVIEVKPDAQKVARAAAAKITTLGKQAEGQASKVSDVLDPLPVTPTIDGKVTVELTAEQAAKLSKLLAEGQ